jgi:hypothetical protein
VRIPNFNNNDLASSPEWRNEAFEICKSEDWDEKCGVEGVLGPRRINFLVVGKVIRDKKMTDMDMDMASCFMLHARSCRKPNKPHSGIMPAPYTGVQFLHRTAWELQVSVSVQPVLQKAATELRPTALQPFVF